MQQLPRLILSIFLSTFVLYAAGQKVLLADESDEQEESLSSVSQKFDSPLTKFVNKPGVADAFPFLSGDGLRLYFSSNREGGHSRFFISTRKNTVEPFGEPVVLSKQLTDGYYAGTLTADELTLCMVKAGKIYISKRENPTSEFGKPVLLKGIAEEFYYGPAISPDGNEIIVMALYDKNDMIKVYTRVSEMEYRQADDLTVPEQSSEPGPGQFSKDGLSYYFSFKDKNKEVSIWRFARRTIHDKFAELEKLPVKINALKNNFHPTVSADGSIIMHTTCQKYLWDEDDIVLVNDPSKSLVSTPTLLPGVERDKSPGLTNMGEATTTRVKTFPNPFQSDIVLEMNEDPGEGTYFILYDLGGKMIKQQRIVNRRTNIELGHLAAATYIYQVVDGKKKLVSSGKLVKS